MLCSSMCLCLGQLVWKLMWDLTPDNNIIYLIGGFGIYFIGGILMIFSYRNGEYSVLQPISSMSYVFATIIAFFILKEPIPPLKITGICLIITGVIFIGRSR